MSIKASTAWSCDERHRKQCRNAHGCHCAEITALLASRDALQIQLIAAQPLYSRRKLEADLVTARAERDEAQALHMAQVIRLVNQVSILTNERDEARAARSHL